MSKCNSTRRLFLKQATALSTLGTAGRFALGLAAMGEASAQSASDYKALVCVFLTGGNDAYNTVLATDDSSWSAYSTSRGQTVPGVALSRTALRAIRPLNSQGRTFGLHPQLPSIQNLFQNERRVAILANVGTLVEPLTKLEYENRSKRIPRKLFSHNDQQTTWQTLGPEGTPLGWGGKVGDILGSANAQSLFTAISASGNSVWLGGKSVNQYQLSPRGTVRYGTMLNSSGQPAVYNSSAVGDALHRLVQRGGNPSHFANDLAEVSKRSIAAERLLSSNLPGATEPAYGGAAELLYTVPATNAVAVNPLAQQFQIIARSIGAQRSLGMKRQVFFVSLGGFDTHDAQVSRHADLMAKLDHALNYFNTTIDRLGLTNQVTTFTASDFGRTFTCNGDGTDHGWGGHHFVMGGAIKGGDIYGAFPTLGTKNAADNRFDGSPDQLANGTLLPKISVDQYGATLSRWMGLSHSQVLDIFPNLGNFGSSQYLGFI